ncbi:hypothetical protein BKA82DRAFT_4021653 [Pisolithus tinctorius]|nr:hypothetical protein BKA82DRAFT_4021653 [Pisolithus tinctorius]
MRKGQPASREDCSRSGLNGIPQPRRRLMTCAAGSYRCSGSCYPAGSARVREMETAMEVRQVIQGCQSEASPLRQAPASRDPGQEISPPVATETRQAIQVAAKAKSVRPRRGPVSLQGKPGNIVVQPRGEVEVADMEVDTHQVTAPAIADYTSNKSQSGRTASCMLRRQVPQIPKHQLGPPGPSLGQGRPNWADATIQQTTNFHPFFDKRATTAVNSNTSLAYQDQSCSTSSIRERCLHQPTAWTRGIRRPTAFSVKVVGHDKFKVVASTANDIESDNEFNQLIFEEAQTGSKRKYLDRDDRLCYLIRESGQRSTTASQAPSTRTTGKASKCSLTKPRSAFCADGKMWAKEIMPALLVWAGSLADPWTISDEELIRSLRIIILTIAPDFEDLNDIRPGTGMSTTLPVAQQLWVHCNHSYHSSLSQDPEIDQDSRKLENIFWSYFVLYLLGHAHLWPCADSPDVPKLKIRELKNTGIKGASPYLCCSNLHHTLSLFKTGKLQIDAKHMSFRKAAIKIPLKVNKATRKELSAVSAFSEQNCGLCTRQYAIAIAKCWSSGREPHKR